MKSVYIESRDWRGMEETDGRGELPGAEPDGSTWIQQKQERGRLWGNSWEANGWVIFIQKEK